MLPLLLTTINLSIYRSIYVLIYVYTHTYRVSPSPTHPASPSIPCNDTEIIIKIRSGRP